MNNSITVEHVAIYNARRYGDYLQATKNWCPKSGGFPHIGYYVWSTQNGEWRKTGYVAVCGHTAIWRKTKKQALLDIEKM